MTIVFRLPSSAAERVAFSYSPAMEAVLSLHVLVEPKHHPVQHEWVRAMRRLSPALKREVDVFAFAYRAYFPEFFFPPAAEELSGFEAEPGGTGRPRKWARGLTTGPWLTGPDVAHRRHR